MNTPAQFHRINRYGITAHPRILMTVAIISLNVCLARSDSPDTCCVVYFSSGVGTPATFERQSIPGTYATGGFCSYELCLGCSSDVTTIGVPVHINVSGCTTNIPSGAKASLEPNKLGFKLVDDERDIFTWKVVPIGTLDEIKAGTLTVSTIGMDGTKYTGTIVVKKPDTCQACTDPDTCSIPGSTQSGNSSVAITFGLGRCVFGKSAGALAIKELYPTNLLATPTCLAYYFLTNAECELISNASGIRQVRVPEGMANIRTNTAYKYTIDIFHPSVVTSNKYAYSDCSACYSNTGPALASIVVENPDSSNTNRIRVTDGFGVVSDYEWKTNGWELTKGNGAYKNFKTSVWTATNVLTVTSEIAGSNGLVQCDVQKYQAFSFGTNLVERVTGSGSTTLTNTYSYLTNSGILDGLLRQVTRPDGSWEWYDYHTNGLRTNVCMGFLNQAPTNNPTLCRSIAYFYGTNLIAGSGDDGSRRRADPRCTIEYIQGKEVARSYRLHLHSEIREIACATPGAAWNDSSNLVTTTKWYDSGVNRGRVQSVERSDGTMDFFFYYFATNSGAIYRTNVMLTGVPDTNKTNIVQGRKGVMVLGNVGQKLSRTVTDIETGVTILQKTYSNHDSYNRPEKVTYLDGTSEWKKFDCCGSVIETNKEGTVIFHSRDELQRMAETAVNGITNRSVFDAAGHLIREVRTGSTGTAITKAAYTYDLAGRRTAQTNALGQVTLTSEGMNANQLIRTNTYPDGSTRIEIHYRDGQLAKVTGTAVHPVRYDYGTEQDGSIWRSYSKEIKLDASGNDTTEWIKTYLDMLGRRYKTVFSDGAVRQSGYNTKGQLTKSIDPDGVTTLYAYNDLGEQSIVATDVNRDGIINTNGADRIQQTLRSVVNNGSAIVERVATYVWSTNNIATSNLLGVADTGVDGLISWNSRYGLTNQSRTKYVGSGVRYTTNTAPDGSFSISQYANGLLQNNTRKDSAGTQLSKVDYFYDEHGRQYAATDARNGSTFYTYNDADRVVATTTPPPGTGAAAQTTTFEHDWAGRVIRTVLPDGTSVTNEYHLTGELKKTYGSRNYPVQYSYDAQGRRTNMITWKNFAADSGKATTTWRYDGFRGFLTNKTYDDGKGPFYTYTPGGRLRTRTWARGAVTTYQTNSVGEIYATTYSDSTPAVTNNFDRLGRSTNIIDGAGSRFLVYNATGQLLGETNSSGAMIGQNLRFTYDQYQRRTNHAWYATNTSLLSHSFAFDGASRITNVSDGTYQGGYSYLANSPLIAQVTYRSNTTTRMTTTKSFDYLNRLTSISSLGGASSESPISFNYAYNDANQRTRVNMGDGSFWIYEYDKLGQVISGKRYWNDWTPVAGQQYEYAFDDIGNRTSTKAGGDAVGASLRLASYTANSLNQYSSRDVPAYLNVLGIANANASVTVNSQSPYRKGEYFWNELSANNASTALWQSVTNIASLTGTNQTNTGNLFLPKTAEAYTYDLDGNLTSDGRWTNKWDAENRLTDMTSHSSGPSGSRKSLQFAYDSQGRRYSKVVSNWTGSAWTRVLHEKFLYDGWNLLGAFDGTNAAVIRSFLWGLDLSRSKQGAGGVGGVIAFRQHSGNLAGSHFAAYDGNGNVMALVDGKTGSASARYEYDPFGQTIRASGTMAIVNPVRFSSKMTDDETDYAYYGYRYFNPNSGRWLGRDPIQERGGRNINAFGRNDLLSRVDPIGLSFYILNLTAPLGHIALNGDPNPLGWTEQTTFKKLSFEVQSEAITCAHCATIKVIEDYEEIVTSITPSSTPPGYSDSGYNFIVAHEDRRAQAYNRAYNAYLARVYSTIDGKQLCCSEPPADLLKEWAENVMSLLEFAHDRYLFYQQADIGTEDDPNNLRDYDGDGLTDGSAYTSPPIDTAIIPLPSPGCSR